MFNLHSLPARDVTAKYKLIGRSQKMRLWTEQWKKGELVMPMTPDQSLVGHSILLGDLGLTQKDGSVAGHELQSPASYCAPERCHDNYPSFASDMCSYMCLFFELYTTARLIPDRGYAGVMSGIVNALGPLPSAWKGSYHAKGPPDSSCSVMFCVASPTKQASKDHQAQWSTSNVLGDDFYMARSGSVQGILRGPGLTCHGLE